VGRSPEPVFLNKSWEEDLRVGHEALELYSSKAYSPTNCARGPRKKGWCLPYIDSLKNPPQLNDHDGGKGRRSVPVRIALDPCPKNEWSQNRNLPTLIHPCNFAISNTYSLIHNDRDVSIKGHCVSGTISFYDQGSQKIRTGMLRFIRLQHPTMIVNHSVKTTFGSSLLPFCKMAPFLHSWAVSSVTRWRLRIQRWTAAGISNSFSI